MSQALLRILNSYLVVSKRLTKWQKIHIAKSHSNRDASNKTTKKVHKRKIKTLIPNYICSNRSNALLVVYFLFAQSFARHGFFGTFPSIDTICNNQMSYRKADLIKRRPNLISQMHIHQSHFQNINWRVAMLKLSNKCSIPFLPIETRLQYFESF